MKTSIFLIAVAIYDYLHTPLEDKKSEKTTEKVLGFIFVVFFMMDLFEFIIKI